MEHGHLGGVVPVVVDRRQSQHPAAGQGADATSADGVHGVVDRVLEHRHLIERVHTEPEFAVHQHHIRGDREHHHLRCPTTGREIRGEQPGFTLAGQGEHLLFDLDGRRFGQ